MRDAVKNDLEETPTMLMQSETFKKNLEKLVYAAVEAKLPTASDGENKDPLGRDDFDDE
ncbi:hypothetical protein ACS3QZ_09110 [Shimia sp. W99]